MTYDEFIKKHNGVAVNYDGAAGKQCVDLATAYFNEVFGSGIKNFWYDAHHFWDLFDKNTWLKANFTKVKNTPSFVPKKGDVAIWSGTLNGGWGHIAICTGEGNTSYFYSYDQNWSGKACTKVKHTYDHIAGFLRPKKQRPNFIADFLIRSIIRTRLFNDYLGSLTNTSVNQRLPQLFNDCNDKKATKPI